MDSSWRSSSQRREPGCANHSAHAASIVVLLAADLAARPLPWIAATDVAAAAWMDSRRGVEVPRGQAITASAAV